MYKNKFLQAAGIIAWSTGFCAAVGVVLLPLYYLRAAVTPVEAAHVQTWIGLAVKSALEGAYWGLMLSVFGVWHSRKEKIEEPIAVEPTPENEKRYLLALWSFPTLTMIVLTFLCAWGAATSVDENDFSQSAYLSLLILFGAAALYFSRHVLHEIFEARYALLDGDKVLLYYIYLGNREYTMDARSIEQTKINHFRFNSDTFSEPMLRVRFGRWPYAILPVNWEDSPKPVPIEPIQPGQLSSA